MHHISAHSHAVARRQIQQQESSSSHACPRRGAPARASRDRDGNPDVGPEFSPPLPHAGPAAAPTDLAPSLQDATPHARGSLWDGPQPLGSVCRSGSDWELWQWHVSEVEENQGTPGEPLCCVG